ncbi:MAG: AEC family transporter [Lachnospiraceae bacterium]|nr:AEC family transporter [Lachnospiraceae bacterium]
MLENLKVTFLIVFPFLAYMTLGFFFKRIGAVTDEFAGQINRFLANVLLPVNIFNSLYNKDLTTAFRNPAALYSAAGTLLLTFLLMKLVPLWEKDPAKQSSMVHCGFRSNSMLFALPIANGIFGYEVPEIVIVLVTVVLINNIEAVPLMEYYRNRTPAWAERREKSSFSVKGMLLGWLKTPLLMGLVAGVLWSLLRIPMPAPGAGVISGLSGTVIPLAFMVLGARLDFGHLKANRRNVLLTVLIKLVAAPALFLIWPIAAGWSQEGIVAVLAGFGAPSAVIAYAMAEYYECDADMAGEIISLSSALSMITIFLWIFGMKQFGLIS